ncbi:glycosyltransferase family 4 protein [Chloroflexota bacterium]
MGTVRPRIAVLYVTSPAFTQRDIAILRSRYAVEEIQCKSFIGIFLSMWLVIKAELVFCWFGSLRFLPAVFIAKILGKKIIIESAGYDAASVPEISYGNMYGRASRYLGRMLFRMANVVLCISRSNQRETIENAHVPPGKTRMIYLGFEHDANDAIPGLKDKKKIVVVVGRIDACTIYRKGFLAAAQLSNSFPNTPFIFVGTAEPQALEVLKSAAGKNAEFTGYLSDIDLARLLIRAKLYLQPSIHEAFGCSVAEAMLYNCIPIVSNKYALPEVVGNAGVYVDGKNLDKAAAAIKEVLDDDFQLEENPRERILCQFPISKRAELLFATIDEVLNG